MFTPFPPQPSSRDLPTFYSWECPSPFQILPTTGLVMPGQTSHTKVTCQPLLATVYEGQAICWYGEIGCEQKSCIYLRTVGEPVLQPPDPRHCPGPPYAALTGPPYPAHRPTQASAPDQPSQSWQTAPTLLACGGYPLGQLSSWQGYFSPGLFS